MAGVKRKRTPTITRPRLSVGTDATHPAPVPSEIPSSNDLANLAVVSAPSRVVPTGAAAALTTGAVIQGAMREPTQIVAASFPRREVSFGEDQRPEFAVPPSHGLVHPNVAIMTPELDVIVDVDDATPDSEEQALRRRGCTRGRVVDQLGPRPASTTTTTKRTRTRVPPQARELSPVASPAPTYQGHVSMADRMEQFYEGARVLPQEISGVQQQQLPAPTMLLSSTSAFPYQPNYLGAQSHLTQPGYYPYPAGDHYAPPLVGTTLTQPATMLLPTPSPPPSSPTLSSTVSPEITQFINTVVIQQRDYLARVCRELRGEVEDATRRYQEIAASRLPSQETEIERERRIQLDSFLVDPPPFFRQRPVLPTDRQTQTLLLVWPLINIQEMQKALKNIPAYNPQNTDPSSRDYLAWYSDVEFSLQQYSNYQATFLLTKSLHPSFSHNILQRFHQSLPNLQLTTVARMYGREVYRDMEKDPVELAANLKMGRDKIFTQPLLIQRVIDLFFCRYDLVKPVVFCYELAVGVSHHLKPEAKPLFTQQVINKYPSLKKMADIARGRCVKTSQIESDQMRSHGLPMTATDCETFAEWIMGIAATGPFYDESSDPFKSSKPAALPPPKPFKPKTPSVGVKAAAVEWQGSKAPCSVHPNAKHSDATCWKQHPELRPPKPRGDNKNQSGANDPQPYNPATKSRPVKSINEAVKSSNLKYPGRPAARAHSAFVALPGEIQDIRGTTIMTTSSDEVTESLGSTVVVCSTIPQQINTHDSCHVAGRPAKFPLPHQTPESECPVTASPRQVEVSLERLNKDVPLERVKHFLTIPFKNNKPVIEVMVDGQLQLFLGDTGSDISLVTSELLSGVTNHKLYFFKHPIVCRPFNYQEENHEDTRRLSVITELAVLQIQLYNLTLEFPFHVFPGKLDLPILGDDFINFTKIGIVGNELYIPLLSSANQTINYFDRFIRKAVVDVVSLRLHTPLPTVTKLVFSLASRQTIRPMICQELLVLSSNHFLKPHGLYQCHLLPDFVSTCDAVLYSPQIYNRCSYPLDHFYVSISSSHWIDFPEGTPVLSLQPLPAPHVVLSNEALPLNQTTESEYPLHSSFQPQQFHPDLPLPVDSQDYPVEDYSPEDYLVSEAEKDTYVLHEGTSTFIQPRPGVRIAVGKDTYSDAHLVLTAKMLAILPEGVWAQERPGSLPGIPPEDVVIPVPLTTNKPVYIKARRLNRQLIPAVHNDLQRQLDSGLITQTRSAYASPITVVPKPGGKIRICVDYREVNKVSVPDRYPLPLIDDVIALPAGCKYLTLLDLPSGFNQLYLHPSDRHRLAFITPDGHYQPIRMPFGWLNGPAAFQREYDVTLGCLTHWARPYIDDLIVCDHDNHRRHDLKLATILYNHHLRGLRVHAEKSSILSKSVVLLGMRVDAVGISPHVKDFVFSKLMAREHRNLTDLQRSIGTLLWYRKFIPSFSFIIRPLLQAAKELINNQTSNENLDDICKPVIKQVADILKDAPILVHVNPDSQKMIHIQVGNSAFATVLYQKDQVKGKQLIEHWSKVWPLDTSSYSILEKYALALRETIKHYLPLIYLSQPIHIFTPLNAFTEIVKHPMFWTRRVQKFLAVPLSLPSEFFTHSCPEVPILNDDTFSEEAPSLEESSRIKVAKFFHISPDTVPDIPRVWTDGSCKNLKTKFKVGGYGVYWGPNSPYNAFGSCQFAPYSNQRAELEAIYRALVQAIQLFYPQLIVCTDSTYAVGLITKHLKAQRQDAPVPHDSLHSFAMTPLNGDILDKILHLLQDINVFFQYIPRQLNMPADALSRRYLTTYEPSLITNCLESSDSSIPGTSEPFSSSDYKIFLAQSSYLTYHPFSRESIINSCLSSSQVNAPTNSDHLLNLPTTPLPVRVPTVPVLFMKDYLNLMGQMLALQMKDSDLSLLREAVLSTDFSHLPASLHFLNPSKVYLAPSSQLLWVRSREGIDKLIAPAAAQLPLIELFHCSSHFGGHASKSATYRLLATQFTWVKMKKQVFTYCENCQVCKAVKLPTHKPPGLLVPLPIATRTFHQLHMDSITGLPTSKPPGAYSNVLVIVDSFTKFLLAYPLSALRPDPIIRILNGIFQAFGAPQRIISDQGSEFKNKVIDKFLHSWGVVQRFVTSHNPQANGQAEAAVKIITTRLTLHLRHIAESRQDKRFVLGIWSDALPQIVYSYNITYQRKLGCCPYQMIFGRMPPVFQEDSEKEATLWSDLSDNYCNILQESLSAFHGQAEYLLAKHRQYMKQQYDQHRPTFQIQKGDFVYLTPAYSDMPKKLSPPTTGPVLVEDVQVHQGTHEVTGVCLSIGTPNRPVYRWFPRYRIRPMGSVNPQVPWTGLAPIFPLEV